MRLTATILTLLVVCLPLGGCGKLDKGDVREFVDAADDAARKRFAPEICQLRGEKFRLRARHQGANERLPPSEIELDRKMFCVEAGKFSQLRQYKLERKSIEIELAADRRTARVTAVYVETMPYYEPDMRPATPDDFYQWQIVESHDESVVGIEGGDLVFLETETEMRQQLLPKGAIQLPYD